RRGDPDPGVDVARHGSTLRSRSQIRTFGAFPPPFWAIVSVRAIYCMNSAAIDKSAAFVATSRLVFGTESPAPLLLPAPWQVPQSARREDDGAAPEPSERPECPDEEEAASGLSDLGIMCPSHVDDGHACGEQPDEQHDDVP